MSNHLGNVLATLTDRKLQHTADSTNRDYYEPDILTATDYYPFGMLMPGRGVALAGCHEELQDATELKGSSDLNSGVTQSGTDFFQNGVRWACSSTTSTISLYNQAMKVESGGSSSDGVYVYIPAASIEASTTYVMEFDILEKSAGISYFNCQVHTPGDDVYRAITRRTGTGHHAVLFTTPATLPSYVRLRITGNVVSTGNYFVVDNFICNKYTAVTQTAEVATDFNTAVMSGVNVSSDGLLWTPLNSTITSFSVVGTTDKKLKVTCTSVNEAWLKLETSLAGGRNYILRFAMTQDTATKRLGLRLYARTGGTWAMTETQGLIYTGNGNYLMNFTHPAGADAIRVEYLRSNSGQPYDGYNTPYTIDDFSISRLDTAGTRMVTVCDPPAGGDEEGLYRYGFNGKENDNEVKGEGNQQDYGMRIYDPRLGRFLSVDPITQEYPDLTPYQFASNRPIDGIDLDGLEHMPSRASFIAKIAPVPKKTTFGSLLKAAWKGIKRSYNDTKDGISLRSLKKMGSDGVGTLKDLGGMMTFQERSADRFATRVTNFASGISHSFTDPAVFFATWNSRSAEENAYGFGYYGFQVGVAIFTERIIKAMNAPGMVSYEGNEIIRQALRDDVKMLVAATSDDLAYLKSMDAKALYMGGEKGVEVQCLLHQMQPEVIS